MYFWNGWIRFFYIDPEMQFKYFAFEWVKPWPGIGMYIHFAILGLFALGIMLGFFYRVSAAGFFLGWAYVFLLEQAKYLNHDYLVCLLCFIMALVPAHHAFSLDALRRESPRATRVPAWGLEWMRAQIGIVLFYAGVAKIKPDWWNGDLIRRFLAGQTGHPVFGPWATQEWMVGFFTYGGLFFDLFAWPLLLWRRTRPFVFVLALGFHLSNATLFHIGIFPWLMIAATTLYFDPDWPRRVARICRRTPDDFAARSTHAKPSAVAPLMGRKRVMAGIGLYLAVQIVVPLRHLLYPGPVMWGEQGQRFSWHLMMRDKRSRATFTVTDGRTGATETVQRGRFITPKQWVHMVVQPDLILQYAHLIAHKYAEQGWSDVQVRADVLTSMAARKSQPLIDPKVNLAEVKRSLAPAAWIVTLTETPPKRLAKTEIISALETYQNRVRQHSTDANAWYYLGLAQFESGNIEAAVNQYSRALDLQPDHANAHKYLAVALAALDQPDEAIPHFETAIDLLHADAELLNAYGASLARAGRLQEAVAQFSASLKIDPNLQKTQRNLRQARADLKKQKTSEFLE
jgi:Flp pilus assembly protein TadD